MKWADDDLLRARRQGETAFRDGLHCHHNNPYQPTRERPMHEAWERGFKDAEWSKKHNARLDESAEKRRQNSRWIVQGLF